jgi:hypothetical protein
VAVGVDNLANEKYFAFHPYSRRVWVIQAKGSF